jgi:glutamine synthetase type III
LYDFLDTEQDVFLKIGVSSPEENVARATVYKTNYMGEVLIEVDTLIYISRRHLIPHAYTYISTMGGDHESKALNKHYRDIKGKLEQLVSELSSLENDKKTKASSLLGCQDLRDEMTKVSETATELIGFLPNNPNFPDLSQFLKL